MEYDDRDFSEEDEMLDFFRELTGHLPEDRAYIAHPTRYPRAWKAIQSILDTVKEADSDVTYEIIFDELLGTMMALRIRAWLFSFSPCGRFAESLALADTLDIEAMTDGTVCLTLGFKDVRVMIPYPKRPNGK
jgi:hypothetical protein